MSRILIIEDDQNLADLIRTLLELEEHTVDHCPTGDGGLTRILTIPYDLVLLDWHLPGLDGLEVLRRFRKRGASTPVILLTGKDSIDDKELGLESGADDYLTKPFNMKELKARVRSQLRRSLSVDKEEIKLGAIQLDLTNQRASKSGRTFALPAEEFKLLEIAARYPYLEPSTADLLKIAVTSGASVGEGAKEQAANGEEVIEQSIRQLRRKLDPDATLIFSHLYPDTERPEAVSSLLEGARNTKLADDLYIGTIFSDKYEVLELIGDGASGLVYRARHIDLGSHVALKILHFNTLAHPETIPRFTREARATAQLSHPNIVAVRDFGLGNRDQPYLVMELLVGASLSEMVYKNGPPPLVDTINIFRQVCAGLDHAHEKGLVHRDIKPSNLLLINDGGSGVLVKIIDFGLARSTTMDQNTPQITETGVVVGSPPYMSPEQCRGELLDKRSDIYSVGCSLFETLQGRPPFCGKDAVEILIQHIQASPTEVILENTPPMVQIRLNKILAKCLTKDPATRFQSAAELSQALEELLGLLGTGAAQERSAPLILSEPTWLERKKSVFSWLGHRLKGRPLHHTEQNRLPENFGK
jgi:serine/threonine protein kinase/DNA-binding response OmpR family regulator